jgi:uncharacterized protein (TIGR02145 family)
VNTGKLAPTGWHVASDSEWANLGTVLGGLSIAGSFLKESGTSHWIPPNSDATNSSGFTALPGGIRYYGNGFFTNNGNAGFWWTTTTVNEEA